MNFDYYHKFLNETDYLDANWCKGEQYQLKTFKKTLDMVQSLLRTNTLKIQDDGELLEFKHIKTSDFRRKLSYTYNNDNSGGDYDIETGRITLNKKFVEKDGKVAFSTICHEITHELEYVLVKSMDMYSKESKEYKYLEMLKSELFHENRSMKAFGIEITGPCYLDASNITEKWKQGMSDLAFAFYALQPAERIAFAIQDSIIDNDKNIVQKEAADIIRKRYCANNLTYEEICKLIDKAKRNLLTGKSPTKDDALEAAMTYDLAVCFKIQMVELDQKIKGIDIEKENECWKLLNPHDRKQTLKCFYEGEGKVFLNPYDDIKINNMTVKNTIPYGRFISLKEFKTYTEEDQKENPKSVALAIYWNNESVISCINESAMDVFRTWYFTDLNDLPDEAIEDIAIAFKAEKYFIPFRSIKVNEFSLAGQQLRKPEYQAKLLKENPHLNQEPLRQDVMEYKTKGIGTTRKEDFSDLLKKFFPKPKEKKNKNQDINR